MDVINALRNKCICTGKVTDLSAAHLAVKSTTAHLLAASFLEGLLKCFIQSGRKQVPVETSFSALARYMLHKSYTVATSRAPTNAILVISGYCWLVGVGLLITWGGHSFLGIGAGDPLAVS